MLSKIIYLPYTYHKYGGKKEENKMESITADQIVAYLGSVNFQTLAINFVVFAAGLLTNVIHRMQKDKVGFIEYWSQHRIRSFASVATLAASFVGLVVIGNAPLYAYFTLAYVSDSLANKSPTAEAKPEEPKDVV
jgi:hypothetical protein